MNKQIELKTAIRSSKANLEEFIPAVVYGGKNQNQLIEIDTKTIERVFHTNAFHMCAVWENLNSAIQRIEKQGGGKPTICRRLH